MLQQRPRNHFVLWKHNCYKLLPALVTAYPGWISWCWSSCCSNARPLAVGTTAIVRSPCVFAQTRCYLLPPRPRLYTPHTHSAYIFSHPLTRSLSTKLQRKMMSLLPRFIKKKKKKKIKNPSQCCNLFWADAVFSERAFGVWFDCLNVTLLIGKPQCLVVLGRGSLLGEQLHLYYLPRFDVWLKHLCVQLCWRWSSTQENLVFFSSTGRSVGPMNASCRSWYFDLHVGGLLPVCFQLPSSSAVSSVDIFQQVIFSLPHSHNRKREKQGVFT